MRSFGADWRSGGFLGQRRDSTTLATVMGLLGIAAAFTAFGAFVGPAFGEAGFWVALIGGLVTLVILNLARNVSPLNLILLMAFATLEGVVLGQVLELYVSEGLGLVVFQAAAATAVAALVAGGIGYTTQKDLSGMRVYLLGALVVVIVASLIGLFVQMPVLWTLISAVSALLFTAFLVFDLNRIARARGATEGQAILLAVSVYLDIFNLFLDLLTLLSGRRRSA